MIASSTAAAGGLSAGLGIVWIVVLFGRMYFMMIRPQKKEQKRTQTMLNSMEVGDSVVTTSGFYGVVIDMTEEDVIVEFGNNKNCRIPMRKQAIAEVEKADQASAGCFFRNNVNMREALRFFVTWCLFLFGWGMNG